jgi:hypothetical protein
MAIKLNFKGIELTVSHPAEAAALLRELTDTHSPKIGRPPTKPLETLAKNANGNQVAIAFLTTIANADADGATADDIAKAVGVKHTKGVGGKAARVNNTLIELGLKPEDIYSNTKTLDGRFWKPRPRIHEAIEILKN